MLVSPMSPSPTVYTFDNMIASLRRAMQNFPDNRTGKNTQYDIMDAASGAFSVFFTQCPSFLSHQKLMRQRYGLSNAKTLFGMQDIPSDNHIRNLLDTAIKNLGDNPIRIYSGHENHASPLHEILEKSLKDEKVMDLLKAIFAKAKG